MGPKFYGNLLLGLAKGNTFKPKDHLCPKIFHRSLHEVKGILHWWRPHVWLVQKEVCNVDQQHNSGGKRGDKIDLRDGELDWWKRAEEK